LFALGELIMYILF